MRHWSDDGVGGRWGDEVDRRTEHGAPERGSKVGSPDAPDLGNEDGVMSDQAGAPTHRRYSKAQKEQAIRPVRQIREETGIPVAECSGWPVSSASGGETVRKWVKQADVDAGGPARLHPRGDPTRRRRATRLRAVRCGRLRFRPSLSGQQATEHARGDLRRPLLLAHPGVEHEQHTGEGRDRPLHDALLALGAGHLVGCA